jgi:hypothetical protein
MVGTLAPLALAFSLAATGQVVARVPAGHGPDIGATYGYRQPYAGAQAHAHGHGHGGRITPPGPGYGWGFPNGNPDGVGWVDYGTTLPLGADRTPDYFFRRQYAMPISQIFFPQYFNPYITRGQRYLPYTGCGGAHPAGGPPLGPSDMPVHPSRDDENTPPQFTPPTFRGRVEAAPVPPGGSGLIP